MGPLQGRPCGVGSRPGPGGGAVGYCVPFGWSGLFRCLGAQRPGGPPTPAGSATFFEESRGKEHQGQAPGPRFYSRSFPLARFGVVGRIVPVYGLLRCPCTCPDLERFFRVGLHNPEASPWGKLSPEVTDEGATGLPNGAGEKFRWGDRWEPPFSTSTRKGWVPGSPPHPTRLRRPTFPPRGRLWVEKNPASQTSGPRKGRNKIQSVFCTDTR